MNDIFAIIFTILVIIICLIYAKYITIVDLGDKMPISTKYKFYSRKTDGLDGSTKYICKYIVGYIFSLFRFIYGIIVIIL